ncbi:MAG TPA: ABC transporter permease [Chitinophagaceae bacterium]|nr:ABC transporter permease [Chitinophagaceae bacterium]
MLKSYLTTAWRNIRKNKVFSFINIIGLSIGMAACLLILQYVNFELSYDQFNKNVSDIYRVYNDRYQNGKLVQHGTITYSGISKAMQDDYPEVINHARVEPYGNTIVSYENKKFGDQQVTAVDNSFLAMFSYPLIRGDENTALKEPFTVILTQTAANRYFGVHDDFSSVIGKAVVLGRDSMPYKITGICKDVPENSHLQFDILLSYVTLYSGKYPYKQADYDFTDSDFWHYIQLRHGTDYKALQAKFDAFSQKYFQGNKVSGSVEKFYLQPLAKAHLYSDFEYEIGNTGSATVVWGLLIIAVFIIVIAWVNYINLSTARSAERAREVGVRKVTGATKSQLVRQFLTESFLINVIALLLGVILMFVLQPAFNTLIGHKLSYTYLFQKSLGGYSVTAGLLALMLAGIFVSGFYPAFVLSSFKPILVLKGKFSASKRGIILRKVLVVGQFAITVGLIIGSFVVYRQIRFMNKQDLGMNIDQMLMLKPPMLMDFDSSFMEREKSFKHAVLQIPGVLGATTTSRVAGNELGRAFNVHRTDDNSGNHYTVRNMGADEDYLHVYGVKLLDGRNFTPLDYNADFRKLHNMLINEAAVKLLGFKSNHDAVGKEVSLFGGNWTVIGIINNVHQKSLRYPLEPTVVLPTYGTYNPISIKVTPQNVANTIAVIKTKYAQYFPGNLFDYFFLDERFNQQYASDQLFGKAFGIFAGFAIAIACLGLLGLSLFATMQRTKEIGVRKVLGASVSNIVLLLSKDFVKLVMVAFIIASPVAYYIMHQWLQDFAYRINVEWWVFAVAGLLAIIIALATISYQAIKAAVANPVKSLRTE